MTTDVPTASPAEAAVLPLLAALAAEGRPVEATYRAGGWRVRLVVEPAGDGPAEAKPRLSESDCTILETIAELPEAPTGQEIARAAGYPYDSHIRMRLTGLRAKGLLGGAKGETGYPLTAAGRAALALRMGEV